LRFIIFAEKQLNPIKRLAGQTAIYGVSTIMARLMNYLMVPIHTRIFSPPDYGIVGEMYAYVSLLIVLLTYGMETAFFRYYEKNNSDREKVYNTTLLSLIITSTIFILAAIFLAKPIANSIRYPNNSEYVIWFALIIAFDAICSIPFAKLRAINRPKVFAFVKIFNISIYVVLNLFFLLLCPYWVKNGILQGFTSVIYNPSIGVGYIFIANLVASGITLFLLWIIVPLSKLHFSKEIWKKMIKYALPLLIFGLAGIVNETIDRILLKYLSPSDIAMSQVGIYSACYKISIMMTIVIQAFKYAAEPFFFSQAKESNAKVLYADVMKYFVILCSLIFLIIMLYIDVVKYFIGEKYFEGLTIVPILLLANMFLGIFYNLSIWYKLTDKTHYGAYLSIFGAIITLALNFLLIPFIGYLGSAWATFACYLSMMIASYFIGQKHYHVNYNIKRIFLYISIPIALYYVSTFVPAVSQWLHFIINSMFLLSFIILVLLIEKPKLSNLINNS
jgi:O-antigen/teichoic acid export membrane protein